MFFVTHYGTDLTDSGATMDQWNDRDGIVWTDFPQDWRNTAGATFDLTGVQIEVAQQGQTRPTPFEHIPFDMSLKRCQRYFQHFVCWWWWNSNRWFSKCFCTMWCNQL